jgi:hypothetical protein
MTTTRREAAAQQPAGPQRWKTGGAELVRHFPGGHCDACPGGPGAALRVDGGVVDTIA